MTEAAPESPAAPAQEQQPTETASPEAPPTMEELQARVEELTKESRKWETRSKENHQAKTELEKQRQAAMTDAERAVAEAEAKGRTAAATEFGKRLATSEIRAAAADVKADLTGVFDYLDLTRFIGEPDAGAIKAFVDALPKKEALPPSFDGGGRSTATGGDDMNKLIRAGLGRG
jgi:hypothetical protein